MIHPDNTTAATAARARTALQTVVDDWPLLRDVLDTHSSAPWPPAGRMADHVAELAAADRPTIDPDREMAVPTGQPPLRIDVLDAMRSTEETLVELADHVAERVQRRPLHVDTGRGWTDDVHRQAAMLAARDAGDRRRWSFTEARTRSAVFAAAWLQQRITELDGPFRPLNPQLLDRIARVADQAALEVELAIATARRQSRLHYPCPHCRGLLRVYGGDGELPSVGCDGCGWTRTAPADAA